MKNASMFRLLFLFILVNAIASNARSDMMIDIAQGNGGLTLTLLASGVGSSPAGSSSDINYGTINDSFFPNGGDSGPLPTNPVINIGNGSVSWIYFVDTNGIGSQGFNSTISFHFNTNVVPSPLASMNGVYNIPVYPGPALIPGTYTLTRNVYASYMDVGTVTLHVSAVPEPSTLILFGFACVCVIGRRSMMKAQRTLKGLGTT